MSSTLTRRSSAPWQHCGRLRHGEPERRRTWPWRSKANLPARRIAARPVERRRSGPRCRARRSRSARADLADARAVIERSDLVFVSGGDVEAGMAHLERHGLIPLLQTLHGAGTPFGGLSAGSIMLSRCWVRWPDPDDDTTAELFSCLALAPVLCDCHAESDDWEELRALLELTGEGIGYGIPAGGALRVDPRGAVTALGVPAARFERRAGRTER